MDFTQLIQMLMAQAGNPMGGMGMPQGQPGAPPQGALGGQMMPQMPMMNIPQFNFSPMTMPAAPAPIQTYTAPAQVRPPTPPPAAAAPTKPKSSDSRPQGISRHSG